jgi:hypothetical protein
MPAQADFTGAAAGPPMAALCHAATPDKITGYGRSPPLGALPILARDHQHAMPVCSRRDRPQRLRHRHLNSVILQQNLPDAHLVLYAGSGHRVHVQ